MSKKLNSPDFDRASTNFYITPIKKKKIKYTNEDLNYYDNRVQENCTNNFQNSNNNKTSNEFLNEECNNTNHKSDNSNSPKKADDKKSLSSSYKKLFKSPFSNFLFHSPVSFENYLNCFSRKKINVLNLIKKNKCALSAQKEHDLDLNELNEHLSAVNKEDVVNIERGIGFDFNAHKESGRGILRTPVKNKKRKILKHNGYSDLNSSDKSIFDF